MVGVQEHEGGNARDGGDAARDAEARQRDERQCGNTDGEVTCGVGAGEDGDGGDGDDGRDGGAERHHVDVWAVMGSDGDVMIDDVEDEDEEDGRDREEGE